MNEQPLLIPEEIREEYEILTASTVEVLPREEFIQKLLRAKREKRPLRIKYGADPSAPDIHLGHSVPIRKLKQFQDLGHHVIFLIGDYTARIGDPSGKNAARPRLSKEQVNENAKTYLDQIFKILDREKTEVVFNSTWLENMDVSATIELMSKFTVSQMLEREDFHKRFENEVPIYLHEFIYPLLQGYDSIAIRADVELGGTDQKFNLLVGRELQRDAGMEPQCIMTMPLLVGLDGVNKMSKSLGNYIGINESARDMFGKAMSIPDEIMWDYFELVAGMLPADVQRLRERVQSGELHPRDAKELLAKQIVRLYHGDDAAEAEAQEFRARFSLREFPEETAERFQLTRDEAPNLARLLVAIHAVQSNREAQRLIAQGGVKVFAEPPDKPLSSVPEADRSQLARTSLTPGEYKLKIGKTLFVVVTLS
ncbi:MAG: tyrosine--tRNA ligase [Candidatus Sumerlaea sp.]|jgi:tyrosyl-tRNA synthetase|uniref:Tyrosine--tRNA ligase n=1 Tax=Sumerlaea chitinivorans TaxID=2250252 RepID=A0A2Z4Y2Y2_SUMC1|nr:Tyrosyl-tRNA synthetase [Candidatus Sumerlaea chitinivorans]GIX44472.1 MAG: tyrosine--tRNA ligase [Candidatus Sumerlaea sp.]